jgi:hypothetical protein
MKSLFHRRKLSRSVLLALAASACIADSMRVDGADIPDMVRRAKPAVVQIVALDFENKPVKSGTGFFISSDGNLLTNYHVVSGAHSLLAKTASGTIYVFKEIIAFSPKADVALLRFHVTDVPHLDLSSTADAVEGQRVLVIGNPAGLEGTVSDGVISAFRDNRTMIQITAPISHGSSGSPIEMLRPHSYAKIWKATPEGTAGPTHTRILLHFVDPLRMELFTNQSKSKPRLWKTTGDITRPIVCLKSRIRMEILQPFLLSR